MRAGLWKRAAPLRVAARALGQIPRAVRRISSRPADYLHAPPILANSFPKSGTHLLLQLLAGLPHRRSYGSFLASMPSFPHRERSPESVQRAVDRLVPGELAGAHLFFAEQHAEALEGKNTAHFFIYRDPRDVVVSEAHYLAEMHRWHGLHRYFAQLDCVEDRISLSILGAEGVIPFDYPDVASRFARYEGWLRWPGTFTVRYEELLGEGREAVAEAMAAHYLSRTDASFEGESPAPRRAAREIAARMLAGFDPGRSHTFRSGVAGGWREVFTRRHREEMKRVAGDLLIRLGYERDLAW